jgi:oligosaccharide repeat unit polymerase
MLLVSCVIFSILTLFNYYIAGRRITYPPFIFCGIWLFLFVFRVVFTQFYLKDIYDIYSGTYLLFIAGGMVTTIAGYTILLQNTVQRNGRTDISELAVSPNDPTYRIRVSLIVICILIFPLFIKYIAAIVIASQVENIFKSIRYETAVVGQGFGIYGYVITFAAFLSLINGNSYWRNPTTSNKYLYVVSLIVAIVYAFCTMGRTPILSVVSFNIALYLISNKKVKLFRLIRIALSFCLLFIVMGVLMDKGGGLNNTFTENVDSGLENLGLYIISPMNAINEVLYHNNILENGTRTFRFFYVLLNSFGIIRVNPDDFNLVDDFLFVPYPVNVYTFYNPYVRDFGFMFSLFSLFVFMAWHCWAFVKSLNDKNSFFPKLTYCFLFYPLLMTIFNDQYASLFSSWLQLYLFAAFYYGLVVLVTEVIFKGANKIR